MKNLPLIKCAEGARTSLVQLRLKVPHTSFTMYFYIYKTLEALHYILHVIPFTIFDFDQSPFDLLVVLITIHPTVSPKPSITVRVNFGWSFT